MIGIRFSAKKTHSTPKKSTIDSRRAFGSICAFLEARRSAQATTWPIFLPRRSGDLGRHGRGRDHSLDMPPAMPADAARSRSERPTFNRFMLHH